MIKINNLTKNFDQTEIFNNASYSFRNKGIVCVLGPSGSGKSTLLNMIAGFDTKYSGEILVGGENLLSKNDDQLSNYRKNNIGFVFQSYNLLKGFSSVENILIASNKDKNDAIELLDKMGIKEKAFEKIENLSGGQKQRVAIARALIDNPNIILADEPTGALDRKTSNEIMSILKDISKEKLVIIITHDKKICEFADEIISIENGKIISNTESIEKTHEKLKSESSFEINLKKQASKNMKVNAFRYIAISLSISIGIIAFMLSLSSGNLVNSYIEDFKAENIVFNNGYVKGGNADTYDLLAKNEAVKNVYYQYKLNDLTLMLDDETQLISEKFPTSKSTQELSYGTMPFKNEIAITPSLAKKFNDDISTLIGKNIVLNHNDEEYILKISGIFNASYDDFIVDFDTEKDMYENSSNSEVYSVSYDVFDFLDVITIDNLLLENGYSPLNLAYEIAAIQSTFDNIELTFLIISSITLIIGIFISALLLSKLQSSRYHEIGLLSALGFKKSEIRSMINIESLYISIIASIISVSLLGIIIFLNNVFKFGFYITLLQILINLATIFITTMVLCKIFSYKLINTEPADALKK